MKKILFILFVAQFILAPYIIKGYGANPVSYTHLTLPTNSLV